MGLAAGTFLTQASPAQEKINIIHIIADDLGWDDVGCYGAPKIKTPNLDRLAREGIRFTDFYAPHATSTPSRAAILTGRFAPRINDGRGLNVLFPHSTDGLDPDKEICLPRLLKEKGYYSAVIGKWHLGHRKEFLPFVHGFDYFYGIPYPNDMGAERRFGLVNISNIMPPVPLIRDTMVIKECDKYDLAELPHWFLRESIDLLAKMKKEKRNFYLQWSNIETHTPWLVPHGFEGRSADGVYGDAVEYFDYSVGILLQAIRMLGLENNTLVVFSSDNGNILSTNTDLEMAYGKYATYDTSRLHQLRGGKGQCRYEGGTRVPCIMRMPGLIPQGITCNEIVTGADLFTTFADIAGVEIPSDRIIDGRSIISLMKGDSDTQVHDYFPGYQHDGTMMSIRKGEWKLAVPSPGTFSIEALNGYQLFNLKSDLGEQNDLSGVYPDRVEDLKALAGKLNAAIKAGAEFPDK